MDFQPGLKVTIEVKWQPCLETYVYKKKMLYLYIYKSSIFQNTEYRYK